MGNLNMKPIVRGALNSEGTRHTTTDRVGVGEVLDLLGEGVK